MGIGGTKETIIREYVRDNSATEAEYKRQINSIQTQMESSRAKYESDLKALEGKSAAEQKELERKLTDEFSRNVDATVSKQLGKKQEEMKQATAAFWAKQQKQQNDAYEAALKLQAEFGDKAIDFGELVLEEKVGDGSYGQVFKGKLRGLTVAIKQFNQILDSTESVKTIAEEFKVLRDLNHPSIVAFIGIALNATVSKPVTVRVAGAAPGSALTASFAATKPQLYLVMEYVEGMNLATYLHDTVLVDAPLTQRDCCDIGAQLSAAMEYVHGKGIVHRDLKPENIMIFGGSRIKVMDFGLAVRRGKAATSSKTSANPNKTAVVSVGGKSQLLSRKQHGIAGTPLFLAPEAVTGAAYDMTRADVYSFGILMWEVHNRRVPFADANIETSAVFASVVANGHRPKWPAGQFPDDLVELNQDCVHPNPGGRPDFVEVAAAYKGFAERESAAEQKYADAVKGGATATEAGKTAAAVTAALTKSMAEKAVKQGRSLVVRPVLSQSVRPGTGIGQVDATLTASQRKRFMKYNPTAAGSGAPASPFTATTTAATTATGGSAGLGAIDAKLAKSLATLSRSTQANLSTASLQRMTLYNKLVPMPSPSGTNAGDSKSTATAAPPSTTSATASLTTDGLIAKIPGGAPPLATPAKSATGSASKMAAPAVAPAKTGPKVCPSCHKSAAALAEEDENVSFSAHVKQCRPPPKTCPKCHLTAAELAEIDPETSFASHTAQCAY